MFNNFISITTSREVGEMSDEEQSMVEHVKSAI